MLLLSVSLSAAQAQRPRTVGGATDGGEPSTTTNPPTTSAPDKVKAKYEGGLFGYTKKIDGALSFDDANSRLLFRDKRGEELFSISYEAIAAASADTQSKRPKSADVIGGASIFTLPARLIKKKYRYLTLQYKDPDTQAAGVTSFKLQDKETLASVLSALASKAGLTRRGEIYVRSKVAAAGSPWRQ